MIGTGVLRKEDRGISFKPDIVRLGKLKKVYITILLHLSDDSCVAGKKSSPF
jgi:hypothetical protein